MWWKSKGSPKMCVRLRVGGEICCIFCRFFHQPHNILTKPSSHPPRLPRHLYHTHTTSTISSMLITTTPINTILNFQYPHNNDNKNTPTTSHFAILVTAPVSDIHITSYWCCLTRNFVSKWGLIGMIIFNCSARLMLSRILRISHLTPYRWCCPRWGCITPYHTTVLVGLEHWVGWWWSKSGAYYLSKNLLDIGILALRLRCSSSQTRSTINLLLGSSPFVIL